MIAAAEPLAGDILKCQIKALVRSDYAQAMSDAQWSRLDAVFRAACATTARLVKASRRSQEADRAIDGAGLCEGAPQSFRLPG